LVSKIEGGSGNHNYKLISEISFPEFLSEFELEFEVSKLSIRRENSWNDN
jgi:hypothetical protein